LHLKKFTSDPVVGLSTVSLNSSLPPHRGQGSSLTSSGFTVAPKVGRKYAVSANQFKRKNAVCIGLVSETQKFGGFAQVNGAAVKK
jgi:hypothetical protein